LNNSPFKLISRNIPGAICSRKFELFNSLQEKKKKEIVAPAVDLNKFLIGMIEKPLAIRTPTGKQRDRKEIKDNEDNELFVSAVMFISRDGCVLDKFTLTGFLLVSFLTLLLKCTIYILVDPRLSRERINLIC